MWLFNSCSNTQNSSISSGINIATNVQNTILTVLFLFKGALPSYDVSSIIRDPIEAKQKEQDERMLELTAQLSQLQVRDNVLCGARVFIFLNRLSLVILKQELPLLERPTSPQSILVNT